MAGQPLAGGWSAILWGVLGDLDYFHKTLRLPRYSSSAPCSLCKATLHGTRTWKNMQQDAPWTESVWKPAEWREWPGRTKNLLFSLPGMSCCNISLDLMHVKFLGVDQYLFGSIFWLLCYVVLPQSPKTNLQVCWSFIKRYYGQHKVKHRYRSISKLTMFMKKKDYPKMRGKASEIKCLAKPIAALWGKFMNKNLKMHKLVNLMLKLSVKMNDIVDANKNCHAYPPEVAENFIHSAFSFGQLQLQAMEYFAAEPDVKAFNLTSKTHALLHIALMSKHQNPSKVWCFRGEDFMARVRRNAANCVAGNSATQATIKMVAHYRIGLELELMKMD